VASGAILSNSNFKLNVQKNVVGNSKTKVDDFLQIAPAGITIGLEALGIKGEHNPLQTAMIFTISNVILNSIVHPLKHFTKVKRPDNSDFKSFPSGHTAEAFASAELMRIEIKENNPWLCYAGYLMAGATGYLRMYNNKHWISDVLAGAGIGIGSTKLALLVFEKIEEHQRFKKYIKGNSILIPSYQQNQICINWIKQF
ncbi:MAG: phosphatase PAP2 family protein, partial [Sphingobacteriales bacterium]|nr:phosphatase PAP2 family protein [Sphingobacteriales bacterium]